MTAVTVSELDVRVQDHPTKDSVGQSHEPEKVPIADTLPYIAPMEETNSVISWMADTGASVDVIDEQMISDIGMTKVRPLGKANVHATPGGDVVVDPKIT